MNNNDILNVLHNNGNELKFPDSLDPSAIEASLSGVKRKSKKGIVSSCVTIGAVCLTVATVFITQSFKISQYDEVYNAVEAVKKANEPSLFENIYNYFVKSSGYELGVMEDAGDFTYSTGSVYASGSLGNQYSDTNVQVDGVDEADFAKTDGRFIYSIDSENIFITNPNNGKPELVSTIETGYEISDLYIHENKLIAVADGMDISEKTSTDDSAKKIEDYGTSVIVYDITNVSSPKEISTLAQSGDCVSTRKIGNVIYLTTSYSVDDLKNIVREEPQTYCPYYSTPDEVKCVEAGDISICDVVSTVEYVTVASIDLNSPENFADMCSVLGGGEDIYATLENIYISSYQWVDNSSKTQILRFSIDGTEIKKNGSLFVDGSILNQFSMDEYNGYFRIVTEKTNEVDYGEYVSMSINDRTTSLYVFDSNLNEIGKTEDLARGESVKSVRFDGDIAYFVTFRQTDPLFTVDLSEPDNPKVLSELKIPGFSQYLHVMSDDLLLGFGRDADEMTGIQEGFKLSMFDASDKTDVSEKSTMLFATENEYSEAEYSHKAVYVDEENYIIGIPYWSFDNLESVYYSLFKYDTANDEFVLLKTIEENSATSKYFDYGRFIRGMRIGESFYVVTNDGIYAYDYSSLEKTGNMNF